MGQYYKPVVLGKNGKTVKKFVYSHDFGNGLKLMEHSYLTNKFVGSFESLILDNPERVVWAGDYADVCKGLKSNVYDRCKDKFKVHPGVCLSTKESRFIINHTKKIFVDKNKVPRDPSNFDMKLHPLPLLTCEGNGRGGGDFRGENELIGSWARNVISVSQERPVGYLELTFKVTEQ